MTVGMRCPACNRSLKPWPDTLHGYRGVACGYCSKKWWSGSFRETAASAAEVAVHDAALRLIAILPFPTDAIDDADVRLEAEAAIKEWSSELPTATGPRTVVGKKKKK